MTNESAKEVKIIRHVTWVGFWVNAVLMVLKVVFGVVGHSDALVADGIHSLSDFATDLIVLAFVGIAYRTADNDHPYGHGKFETFATLLIAVALFAVGIGLLISGVKSVIAVNNGEILPRPGVYTIIIALLAIASKEWLYRYTYHVGKRVNSTSLMANAWHHRSDAISSVATLLGVTVAYFFGEHWRVVDPLACVLIAIFICVSAIQIARPSIDELLERSLPEEDIKKVETAIQSVAGVKAYHHLRTRRNGHSAIVDVHVKVDPTINVAAGHDIATAVESAVRTSLGNDVLVNVHIEPYRE